MEVQQCSKTYKNLNSFQKMTLIVLDKKEQFDSVLNSQLHTVNNDNKHNINKSESLTLSSQLKSQKTCSLSIPNSNQQSTKHQQSNVACCQSIAVPRYGKVTVQNLIRKSKKLSDNKNDNQQSLQSIIEHSGYFRYVPAQLLINFSQDISNHQHQHKLSLQSYLPTQPDIQFLNRLRQQYKPKLQNSYTLSTKTFCDIITSCQNNYHKLKNINLETSTSQNILLNLQFKLPSKLTSLKVEHKIALSEMFKDVIQYWRKVKLQQYKLFPMIRTLWPKTDLQQLKYTYFVPYKSRTLSKDQSQQLTTKNQHQLKQKQKSNKSMSIYSPKYPITSSTIRNKLGRTQRQVKINRQSKQLSMFYQHVKQISKENYDQRQLFYKELKKFHKLANLYNLSQPQWYSNVVDNNCKIGGTKKIGSQKILNKVDKLSNKPYFSHPIVRLKSFRTNQHSKNWQLHKQYNINYDNNKSQVMIMPINDIKRNKRVKKSN